MLLVVVECLKDRSFHIDTVYVNSLDPSRGCTLQAELMVTLQAEATALQWESVVAAESPCSFIMVSCAMFMKVISAAHYLKLSCFLLYPLTV